MKKYGIYLLVCLIGLLILGTLVWWEGRLGIESPFGTISADADAVLTHGFVTAGLLVALGFLVEWKRVLALVRGQINIDLPLLLVALALVAVSSIAAPQWYFWFRGTDNFIIQMLQAVSINNLLSLLAGIILVRALTSATSTDSFKGFG